MVFSSDDLPPQLTKDVKRRNRKRRTVRSKDVEELISVATRAAHIARDKGFHVVSPEAIRCVEVLRIMRSLPLTPRLITKTNALPTLQFLATNGNPKIRSESKSLLCHLKGVLASS
ncbi:Transcription elongation factor [Hirschfeldia incana]|nr:Transcription elongation factor [Hirschfeldia incana]